MPKKFVITGGAGFIGSNLTRALANENEVIVIDDLSAGKRENLEGVEATLVKGSILDRELLKDQFRKADLVFHLAAIASVERSVRDPLLVNEVNLNGTLNVLEEARLAGVRRVVFSSTAAVYGTSPDLPKREDMTPDPRSPYAVAKLAGEHYCRVFSELFGLPTVVLRFFNVFGPRQDPGSEYSGVISRFISALLEERKPVVYGDGEQTRDFVYVADVVRALILAGGCSRTGSFNVARGESTSLNRLLEILGRVTGRDAIPQYREARRGDIRHSLADVSLYQEMGYRPEYSIEEGLRRTVDWFSEQRPG
ncbi:MAG: SDR family oxidoreductase [Methanotrichaceae archaeon]|nr:SDR family oxidoreductase [Methanotrichaceae archaeon]